MASLKAVTFIDFDNRWW